MRDHAEADAPGRVNLIGEHTDYHEGFVLPTIIPRRTRVHLVRRGDRLVRALSVSQGPTRLAYELGQEQQRRDWLDYVQGTTRIWRAQFPLSGFDLEIDSDVPAGAGVSSSAALTVSLLRGLRTLMQVDLDDRTLARMARAVETDFVGAPVGVMDQMAASLGRDGEALFIDTRTLAVDRVPLPATMELGVIDSGIAHRHAAGGYITRRRESSDAAAMLGVSYLRDADGVSDVDLARLPPLRARRARHVITENRRVIAAVKALRAGDLDGLGALLGASHASLREDYEVTTPEIDLLVQIATSHQDIIGARMTGGGFGGSVVIISVAGTAATAAAAICRDYCVRTGQPGRVLVPAPHG